MTAPALVMSVEPDHRVPLAGGWMLWKWVEVRGAGFPARDVLQVAAPELSGQIDALLELAATADEARSRALDAIRALAPSRATRKAKKKLLRGDVPELDHQLAEAAGPIELFSEAATRARQTREAIAAAFERHESELGARLREVGSDSRFREAITWQNRRALRSIEWLRAHPDAPRNRRCRHNQELVARYLQRYSTKNETIGFFGPVGFGEVRPEAPGITCAPGPELLARRTVYFEHWCIDTLASRLAEQPSLKRWTRPRRIPSVRLEGNQLHYGIDKRAALPDELTRVLERCDGDTTAAAIAAELELDAEEVLELIEELADSGICTTTFEVPTVAAWPDRLETALERTLESAGAEGATARAEVSRFEKLRDDVAAAADDPDRLDRALAELERRFESLTGSDSTRRSGQAYAGRTVVYEECRRDLELQIGQPLLDRLGPPLALMTTAARWFTHRIATLYRGEIAAAYDRLRAADPAVPYLELWRELAPQFPSSGSPPRVDQARTELQRRWALCAGDRCELRAAELAAPFAEHFAAPGPGWPGARYHSPDILIAAPTVDAIAAGGGVIVLGELHPAVNTIHLCAQREHDDPEALIRAREIDIPEPVAVPVIGKDLATRADHVWLSRQNVDVELGPTRSWRPRDQVVAVADLVVESIAGRLTIRDRAGRHAFDPIVFFDTHLSSLIANEFQLLPVVEHQQRVTIDGVVIARETWQVDPASATFASAKDPLDRLIGARRWAAELGLPRWVFVKIPEERKPVYVDLESPIYVDMLARSIRAASHLSISEMLPTPDQTWLPDARGNHYSCELRFVALDPLRFKQPE